MQILCQFSVILWNFGVIFGYQIIHVSLFARFHKIRCKGTTFFLICAREKGKKCPRGALFTFEGLKV